MFIQRCIEKHLKEAVRQYPIIGLTGPRQSGKTTLLRAIFPDYEYVSLEREDLRVFATEDPRGFLKQYDGQVFFDEAQRVPSLFSYLQVVVDEYRDYGRYLLSGSQNFLLMEKITQSLAGRIALFRLFPFDFVELKQVNLLTGDWVDIALQGFYPPIYDRNIKRPATFYANYANTYIERDVRTLKQIKDLGRFSDFLELCANAAGQLLNINSLAKSCGISQPTAKSWLNLLEQSYIVFLLRPYYKNFKKRIVKHPKLYFYDTGLLAYLLGYQDPQDLFISPHKGALFENLIVADVQKQNAHKHLLHKYWFWQDSSKREIDMLYQKKGKFHLMEIKATETILPRHFKNFQYFSSISGEDEAKRILVYTGQEHQKRKEGELIPWSETDRFA